MSNSENIIDNIKALEFRNYLLEPGLTRKFKKYFHSKFVDVMQTLKGYTLGEFAISGKQNRFVWLRGFADMTTRLKFLNDFYINSDTWKKYGSGANEMMINSDNVYLLKPLKNSFFEVSDKQITVIDFYYCNGTLEKTIKFFENTYLSFLATKGIHDISLWLSEMTENDFPRLPVFQDKNLLLTISNFGDNKEYKLKQKLISGMNSDLKKTIIKFVTIHHSLKLINLNYKKHKL
jgi:hypothetical protein